ncbi:MAG: ribonuclease P protein component [Hyphomicrobiales bacterium]|nr:ribonuclease P protein component [Hyphomicrobiales bacterium]
MISKPNARLESLRKRRDFIAIRTGRRQHSPSFLLQMRERREEKLAAAGVRVGYTVTKKTGNAVERNRIKRRMRAVVHQVMPIYAKQTHDYVLIGKRAALNTEFKTMVAELGSSLSRVHQNSNKSGTKYGKQ